MHLLRPIGQFLPPSVYSHLWFEGDFQANVKGAQFLIRHHGTEIENELFWRGTFWGERSTVRTVLALFRDTHSFIDIGANTGFYSLLAKSSNPKIKVMAVEPSPANFRALKTNIKLNPWHVELLEAAVTDHNGEVTLHDFPGLSYSASLDAEWREGTTERRVSGHTLDSLVDRHGLGTGKLLVKIDVEGHEPEVLKGAERTINAGAQFLIEIIRDNLAAEISELLRPPRHQYRFIDERTGAFHDVSSQLAEGKPIPPGNYLIGTASP